MIQPDVRRVAAQPLDEPGDPDRRVTWQSGEHRVGIGGEIGQPELGAGRQLAQDRQERSELRRAIGEAGQHKQLDGDRDLTP